MPENVEQAVMEKLKALSIEAQQEVLDFVEFLYRKKMSSRLSLKAIASLPPHQRKEILEPYIDRTAEDFKTDSELTEFEILDIEDWDREYDES